MHTLLQDLRYALRQLRKSPGFTLAAVLTLAIGIGANTGGYSVMDAVVLRPLAVPDLHRVMTIFEVENRDHWKPAALANYQDWLRQSHSFEQLAVHTEADMSLTGAGDAAHVQADYASPSLFTVLQSNALLGRVFDQSETQPGRNGVAVLSYYFWKQHFSADAGVIGRKIELNQHTYTVIGVMPKALQYPSTADLYIPFAPDDAQLADRATHDYQILGRLRKGVTRGQAQAEMNVIAERLAQQYPGTNQGWTVIVEPLVDVINGDLTPLYFRLMQGATLLVLLVICANLANLQLARGIARQPEMAMRTALGASRFRVLRQLLTENILLGLMGAAGGLLIAQLYLRTVHLTMPARMARYLAGWSNITLNGRALAYSLLLAVAAGVISGFAPTLAALRLNLVDQLKSGSRAIAGVGRTRWARNIFAVAQIALAVTLVVGAALMAKGIGSMTHSADRYNPGQMLTFGVHLPPERYDTQEKQAAWYAASLDKLRSLPGVQSAEITAALPLNDNGGLNDWQIENRPLPPGKFHSALRVPVSSGYFPEFHIPLLSGRLFTRSDDLRSQPVAVVSRGFQARYFPGDTPLGKRIRIEAGHNQTPWLTIVGIVEEADYSLWHRTQEVAVYVDAAQIPPHNAIYAVVAGGDPLAIAPAARKALAGLDPTLPLDAVETYAQLVHENLIGVIYVVWGMGFDALIALLLAAIGIFAVMANLVGERTREIGVRLAMGARREDVVSMILRRAAWLTGAGVVMGLLMAIVLAHATANLLYGVRPDDPAVFAAITIIIAAIALVSSWFPARRASRIDPMVALRDE